MAGWWSVSQWPAGETIKKREAANRQKYHDGVVVNSKCFQRSKRLGSILQSSKENFCLDYSSSKGCNLFLHIIIATMPPAATILNCTVIDVGGIEVEQISGEDVISLFPSEAPKMSDSDRFAYFQSMKSGDKCYATSFDSIDEIDEDSNEAKLINRIAQKAIVQSSETNASDFNEAEAQYLDVLDRHIEDTYPEMTSFADLETEADDHHPKKNQFSADEMLDHFLDSSCCQCSQTSNTRRPLRSSLKSPRWSSICDEGIPARSSPVNSNSVKFSSVETRMFLMTLGYHPGACSGPPIRLDYDSSTEPQTMDMEEYEKSRYPKRNRRQLKLSLQQRHNILVKERGFSFEEVKGAWQNALEIRKERQETLERGLALMKWDEVYESACRKFNRLVDV